MRIVFDIETNGLHNPTCEECGEAFIRARSSKRFCSMRCVKRSGKRKRPALQMLQNARDRARRKGLAFDLKPEDIQVPEVCPLLGISLKPNGVGYKGTDHDLPSLDRIDNTKGYTKDNVWVISNRANRLKADATLDELKKIGLHFI